MANNQYLVKLVLGDPSGDGHGVSKDMKYTSNYDAGTIWTAYMASCKQTGVQFNHNENYTGLPDLEDWQQIFTEYQDCYLSEKAAEVLKQHGIDPGSYGEEDDDHEYYFEDDEAAGLIMAFIGLNMPKDWTYSLVEDDFDTINGPQFCYGLFG